MPTHAQTVDPYFADRHSARGAVAAETSVL
jgi:hypothetical protein